MLLTSGAPLLLVGLWREWDGLCRPLRDPAKALTWVRGFRLLMIGLALAGSGAGWLLDQTWLIVLSLAIGGEEMLESSIMHFALTAGAIYSLPSGAKFQTYDGNPGVERSFSICSTCAFACTRRK